MPRSGGNTQVKVAIIGLIGVLGAALIAVLPKLIPSKQSTDPSPTPAPIASSPMPSQTPTPISPPTPKPLAVKTPVTLAQHRYKPVDPGLPLASQMNTVVVRVDLGSQIRLDVTGTAPLIPGNTSTLTKIVIGGMNSYTKQPLPYGTWTSFFFFW